MANIEDEIRARTSQDTYNREFMVKFNLAIQELEGDKMALVVFMSAVIPVMKQFAKNNKQTFDEFWEGMRKYAHEAKIDDMEFH